MDLLFLKSSESPVYFSVHRIQLPWLSADALGGYDRVKLPYPSKLEVERCMNCPCEECIDCICGRSGSRIPPGRSPVYDMAEIMIMVKSGMTSAEISEKSGCSERQARRYRVRFADAQRSEANT